MDRIKFDVAINVPEDIRDDILKIKAIEAEFDRCDSVEELTAAEAKNGNLKLKSDVLNGVVDIIAADETLAEAIKEAIRIYVRSL